MPLQVKVEAAVELAYSLSEHGLTPAAFRAFAISMAHHQDQRQVLHSAFHASSCSAHHHLQLGLRHVTCTFVLESVHARSTQ